MRAALRLLERAEAVVHQRCGDVTYLHHVQGVTALTSQQLQLALQAKDRIEPQGRLKRPSRDRLIRRL